MFRFLVPSSGEVTSAEIYVVFFIKKYLISSVSVTVNFSLPIHYAKLQTANSENLKKKKKLTKII